VTTEEDFQAELDRNPDAHHTRLVFADWLQDRDDPRAAGYRELGRLRRCPAFQHNHLCVIWWWSAIAGETIESYVNVIPRIWLCLSSDWVDGNGGSCPVIDSEDENQQNTRREVEDKLAFAFTLLSDEQRAEIANMTVGN
jgi:uncharacterized protein (TIGR02996 family)